VDANNFGSTSFSPGAIMWAEQQVYMLKYPQECATVMDSGMLPTHEAEDRTWLMSDFDPFWEFSMPLNNPKIVYHGLSILASVS
jgi:hypothetical protein